MSGSLLFAETPLSAVLEAHGRKLDKAVAELAPDRVDGPVLEVTTRELVEEYSVHPLVLDEANISTATRETEIDVSGDWNRFIVDRSRSFLMKGTTASFFVPFSGDRELVKCQPSSFTLNPPFGRVTGSELLFEYSGVVLDPGGVRTQFEQDLSKIRRYVGWVNGDVEAFNTTIQARVEGELAARRDKIERDRNLAGGLGFKERGPSDLGEPAVKSPRAPARAQPVARPALPNVAEVIRAGEGSAAEFKATLRWDIDRGVVNKGLQDEVLQAIAAFLNSDGGTLLIGVRDDGSILGLTADFSTFRRTTGSAEDQFLQTISNLVADVLGASFARSFDAQMESVAGEVVCRVTVARASKPAYITADLYIRMGNTSRKLSTRDAVEYVRTHWPNL